MIAKDKVGLTPGYIMETIVFATLSRLDTFLSVLENLKTVQSQTLTLLFHPEGLNFLVKSPGKDIQGEAHLDKLHFTMYQVNQASIQLSVDFKQLLNVVKSVLDSAQLVTVTYPVADSKLMMVVQDDRSSVQYLVETLVIEEEQVAICDPEMVQGWVKFGDFRPLKQALDLITHGKQDSNAYVTLVNDRRGVLVFTKNNDSTNVKARVSVPLSDKTEVSIKRDCEKIYSTRALRHLVNVLKCQYVAVKMYQDGALEVEIRLTGDCWTKRVLWPVPDIGY